MSKRILFISCRYNIFNNIDCGASNRSTMFVKALTQVGEVDIISFAKNPIYPNIKKCNVIFQKNISDFPKNYIKKGIKFLCAFVFPWSPYSYYSLDKEKSNLVKYFMTKGNYDYVACRYIEEAVSCDLLKYSYKLILDVDDNLVSATKRDIANSKFTWKIYRWIANKRANLLGLMSKHVLKNVKHSFYSNIAEPPYSKSVYLPNVTMQKVNIPALKDSVPKRLLIVGWLDFYPNRYGVLHFVQNVMPLIHKKIPDVELYIAGKCKDIDFLNMLNSLPKVRALGYVKDILTVYRLCGIIIVPVYQGAGTSVKFVEGLMTNRPIVSTPLGVRGFESICKARKHYLLAEDDIAFSENIISILNSVEKAKNIAKAAYEIGMKCFSQENFMNIVKSEILK